MQWSSFTLWILKIQYLTQSFTNIFCHLYSSLNNTTNSASDAKTYETLLYRMFGKAKNRRLVSVGCAMWTRTNCPTLRGCIHADVEELFNGFTNDAFKDTSMSDPFKATSSNSSRNTWFFSWGHYRSMFTLRYKKSLRLLFPILFCAWGPPRIKIWGAQVTTTDRKKCDF